MEGCSTHSLEDGQIDTDASKPIHDVAHTKKPYDKQTYRFLAQQTFQSGGESAVEVNQNHSTLDLKKWVTRRIIYGNLDHLNRTTFVTAYIDQKNIGKSIRIGRQTWSSTGWNQKDINEHQIYNRGSLLAYKLSFNFDQQEIYKPKEKGSIDNPKNLATQTAFSNQEVKSYYDHLVYEAENRKGNDIIYQIVTVFRGKEKMARGYWLQAKDSQGTIDFNVYVWNIQPYSKFHYEDGTCVFDRNMKVKWNKKVLN